MCDCQICAVSVTQKNCLLKRHIMKKNWRLSGCAEQTLCSHAKAGKRVSSRKSVGKK